MGGKNRRSHSHLLNWSTGRGKKNRGLEKPRWLQPNAKQSMPTRICTVIPDSCWFVCLQDSHIRSLRLTRLSSPVVLSSYWLSAKADNPCSRRFLFFQFVPAFWHLSQVASFEQFQHVIHQNVQHFKEIYAIAFGGSDFHGGATVGCQNWYFPHWLSMEQQQTPLPPSPTMTEGSMAFHTDSTLD